MRRSLYFLTLCIILFSCSSEKKIKRGLKLTSSAIIANQTYIMDVNGSFDEPLIIISGKNTIIDFQGAIIESSNFEDEPESYYGLGILVTEGENITLKNLNIRGFKIAIKAEGVNNLKLENIDGSYNYRPRLKSTREREDLGDWMSFHDNSDDNWLKFGAAFYINNCDSLQVNNCRVTQGQCALMMSNCHFAKVWNNNFSFNSAIGIGLYASSNNQFIHNKMDWNVRGYSHGIYRRGQDSAGFLVYEQSSNNVFAYNSATHSGDGFFLWAGNSTIESGEGGCNDNLIYRNDFSHAPTNGIEVTFSSNQLVENLVNDCRYGVWAGYSHHTQMRGNQIKDNVYGIAIEHGYDNVIEGNYFENDSIGIQLWERNKQPAEWAFAHKLNVSSRNTLIRANDFSDVHTPFQINQSEDIHILDNYINGLQDLVDGENNPGLVFKNSKTPRTDHISLLNSKTLMAGENLLVPLFPDGQYPFLPASHPRGIQYIFINEWGPYNFEYPAIFLSKLTDKDMYFSLMGPTGNWKLANAKGFNRINPKTGSFPTSIHAEINPEAEDFQIDLEFIGNDFIDQFGNPFAKGTVYPFGFSKFIKDLEWVINWVEYPEKLNPINQYSEWIAYVKAAPAQVEKHTSLGFRWWGSPMDDIHPDRFATVAECQSIFKKGKYKIEITSDDGMKFYIDEKLVIDHWNIHTPETDYLEIELDGLHHFRIEHFEAGGLATLDFRIKKL